ncbi:unnamed protein product [Dibothriocephalus latus]|uniref:HIT-type domain-containing protein n=1 Tax=Dibothriocephalus latus TaxID=60516 RepID=A0A3P7Q4Q5_DIBLA|nr:unnamed protein product [Dibothriocephalus latus]
MHILRRNQQTASSGLVRTRLAYQNSQSSLWSLEDLTGAPSDTANQPTAAQLEARLRRIVRRRESAKHKAEMEKMQTVEKLLRVPSSDSEDSEQFPDSNTVAVAPPKNALHPSATLDPPAGYIRLISSERFSPDTTVLALPPTIEISLAFPHLIAPPEPVRSLCSQCCLRPRRYACPKTGKPLCSLECFKALRGQSVEVS